MGEEEEDDDGGRHTAAGGAADRSGEMWVKPFRGPTHRGIKPIITCQPRHGKRCPPTTRPSVIRQAGRRAAQATGGIVRPVGRGATHPNHST